jgi:hypothetical protein
MKRVTLFAFLWLALGYASRAEAETITGRMTYADFIPQLTQPPINAGRTKPIRSTKIEIWHRDANAPFFGIVDVVESDSNGFFTTTDVVRGQGVFFARIFALNEAADVFSMGGPATFFKDSAQITTNSASAVIDLSAHFTAVEDAGLFNISQVLISGFNYANAHRAPGETDTITRVLARPHYTAFSYAYYDRAAILISNYAIFEDFTILHEYGHFVQEKIGTFAALPASHDGCSINSGSNFTNDLIWKWLAWQEGFASYFAHRALGPVSESSPPNHELPNPCSFPGNTVEDFVAAALLDLADPVGSLPGDELDLFAGHDDEVFHIFDRDMDLPFGSNPTIEDFVDAWIARGNDYPPLFDLFTDIGIVEIPEPMPIAGYPMNGKAPRAIWRSGANAFWHIKNNDFSNDATVILWGVPNDIPVPADYDGDNISDVAIYRPSTAEWWVKKSGSLGAIDVKVWGDPCTPTNSDCDIPTPGDFDGDGEQEYAIYRPTTGQYWVLGDTAGESQVVDSLVPFAQPAVADYTGDGRDDFGTFVNGLFFSWVDAADPLTSFDWVWFGVEGIAVPGDYQKDAKAEIAVFETVSPYRYMMLGAPNEAPVELFRGLSGDIPVPADFNGDRKIDAATWRPSDGIWRVKPSNVCPGWYLGPCSTGLNSQQWGISTDKPAPGD